ncbi:hypothetical protein G9A89_010649 [Geosiphon pyriformis]|nr:hypothetical protein G9A89_010649 [Geosiphon pyriformis]
MNSITNTDLKQNDLSFPTKIESHPSPPPLPRPFIFIDSSDPTNIPNLLVTPNDTDMIFRPPFPPILTPQDLISKKQKNSNPTKPPNAFIIYRRAFVKASIDEGYQLPMTVISAMASQAWQTESSIVKEEYKRIAESAKIQHDILYPKLQRKESKRWRVSPQKPVINVSSTTMKTLSSTPLASSTKDFGIIDGLSEFVSSETINSIDNHINFIQHSDTNLNVSDLSGGFVDSNAENFDFSFEDFNYNDKTEVLENISCLSLPTTPGKSFCYKGVEFESFEVAQSLSPFQGSFDYLGIPGSSMEIPESSMGLEPAADYFSPVLPTTAGKNYSFNFSSMMGQIYSAGSLESSSGLNYSDISNTLAFQE